MKITRWSRLIASTIAMIMIANLQYAWTFFVKPIMGATGWKLSEVQLGFTLFIAFETWMMPLSGWFMVTTTPVRVPTVVFGLFALPYPLAPDLTIYRFAHAAHVALAIVLAALIAIHVAAAMVHTLLWRDRTLARMWREPTR